MKSYVRRSSGIRVGRIYVGTGVGSDTRVAAALINTSTAAESSEFYVSVISSRAEDGEERLLVSCYRDSCAAMLSGLQCRAFSISYPASRSLRGCG